jgi:hypothetical protein
MMDDDSHIRHPGAIRVRVVYHDVDLIELETDVRIHEWRGIGRAYASSVELPKQATALVQWSLNPTHELIISAGADTGIGWLVLRFYVIDMAGHIACDVTIATPTPTYGQPHNVWRLSVQIPTEAGLLERFANELLLLSDSLKGEATLEGVG